MENQQLTALSRRSFLAQGLGGIFLTLSLPRAHCREVFTGREAINQMDQSSPSFYNDLKLHRVFSVQERIQKFSKQNPQFHEQLQVRLQVLHEIDQVLRKAHDPWMREKALKLIHQDERARSFLVDRGAFDWAGYASFLRRECWDGLVRIVKRSGESGEWVLEKHSHLGNLERVGIRLTENVWARLNFVDQQVSWWIESETLEHESLLQRHSICLGWAGDLKIFAPDGRLVQTMESVLPLKHLSSKDWLSSPMWAMKMAQERFSRGS